MAACVVLELGLRWRVGNGEQIKIWGDKWIQTPNSFQIQSPIKLVAAIARVNKLMTKSRDEWSNNLFFFEIFWEE